MEIQFNTGRHYTEQGQLIRAKVLDDGSVLFADDSRKVSGHILGIVRNAKYTEASLQSTVMHHYDHNNYKFDSAAWSYLVGAK